MRSNRKNQRKALKALALGFATAAIFTTTASAQQVRMAGIPEGDNYVANLVRTAGVDAFAVQHVETPYLSITESLANQSTRDGGPVFMNGVPDGYVGSGVERNQSAEGVTPTNLARAYHPIEQRVARNQSAEGVTPTNLARAYHPIEQGVAQPDGFQPQLQGDQPVIVRDKPDGFQPQTKSVGSATVSASSDGLDRGDLALGFGLGLILATACAIALAMTRDRQRTRMAHS
jgi:hypothetical protein